MSRLDHFLVSTDWMDLFPDCAKKTLACLVFDHCLLCLETGMEDWGPPLRFEIMWLYEKDFSRCVTQW